MPSGTIQRQDTDIEDSNIKEEPQTVSMTDSIGSITHDSDNTTIHQENEETKEDSLASTSPIDDIMVKPVEQSIEQPVEQSIDEPVEQSIEPPSEPHSDIEQLDENVYSNIRENLEDTINKDDDGDDMDDDGDVIDISDLYEQVSFLTQENEQLRRDVINLKEALNEVRNVKRKTIVSSNLQLLKRVKSAESNIRWLLKKSNDDDESAECQCTVM